MRPSKANRRSRIAIRAVVAVIALTVSLSLPLDLLNGSSGASIGVAHASQGCPSPRQDGSWPELDKQIQAKLDAAGLVGAQARVYVAHQRCLAPPNRPPVFTNEEAEIVVDMDTEAIYDDEAVAGYALSIIESVLPAVITQSGTPLPALATADLRVSYTNPTDHVRRSHSTSLTKVQEAHAQGLTGAALLKALGPSGYVL